MKKIYITLFTITAFTQFSYAQWSSGTNIYNTNTGNVGIGNTNPNNLLTIGSSTTRGTANVIGSTSGTAALSFTDSRTSGHSYTFYNGLSGLGNLDIFDQTAQTFRLTINSGGKVGIGTITPNAVLDVQRNINAGPVLRLGSNFDSGQALDFSVTQTSTNNGYYAFDLSASFPGWQNIAVPVGKVGIGTTTPVEKLNISTTGTSPQLVISQNNLASSGAHWYFQSANGKFYLGNTTNNTGAYASLADRLIIDNTGNVGIGTPSPDEKLTVNGTIHSKEVKVNNSIPVPDYVFKKTYKLPSLRQLKTYLKANHHLPEIPSATEIAENGLDLGEMNLKLLKKVEQLTLYAIDQKEENEKLKQRQQKQEARIAALEKALATVTSNK